MRQLVADLAQGLRSHVLPLLGSHAGRAHVQAGAGGDVTFEIDRRAEDYLERFLAERAPAVSFYSEDRGLVEPSGSDPEWVLVVDPIDGTRPAMAGFESCCVSVAAAPLRGRGSEPAMGDVAFGCVTEIKSGASFLAQRGAGVELLGTTAAAAPTLSENTDIARMFWTFGFRGRPAEPLMEVLGELVDRSSVGGAVFDLGSATYDMTRIVTGQLDAYIDVGTRMIEQVPAVRERFEAVGHGAVLNNSPYDVAAAALCLQEAGAVVTDAYGEPLDRRPLLGSGHEYQMSCLAAGNERLHAAVLEQLEHGFARLAARRALPGSHDPRGTTEIT